MEVLSLHEAPKVQVKRDGHIMCRHKNIEMVHLNIKPGEVIEKHINTVDVVFYVLEGKANLETDDQQILVHKDDCITVKAGTCRGFNNISLSNFKVLVIKILP